MALETRRVWRTVQHKGTLRLRIGNSILDPSILLCQSDFQLRVLGGNIRVHPHILTKKQRELFTETPCSPYMDMHARLARGLTEIAFCSLRIVGAKDISKTL